jgi:hypothetical protein
MQPSSATLSPLLFYRKNFHGEQVDGTVLLLISTALERGQREGLDSLESKLRGQLRVKLRLASGQQDDLKAALLALG